MAVTAWIPLVTSRIFLLFQLSDTQAEKGFIRSMGIEPANADTPTQAADLVKANITQLPTTMRIHRPLFVSSPPVQKSR